MIARVTVLHGHVSPETAFVQDNYPYGRLRCYRRVWIEQATKGSARGQYRSMWQTGNPKRTGSSKFGQDPGGHPWNNPKPSTYSDWMVLYLDENEHVHTHGGSLIYGLSGPEDARMRLDGTYDQLTADERTIYDRMVQIGHRADRWEHWHKALDFIRTYRAEHGTWPSQEDVRQAPGFYLDSHYYDVAIAAARDLPAPGQAAAGQVSAAAGQDMALPAAAQGETGSPAAVAGQTGSTAEGGVAASPGSSAGLQNQPAAGSAPAPADGVQPPESAAGRTLAAETGPEVSDVGGATQDLEPAAGSRPGPAVASPAGPVEDSGQDAPAAETAAAVPGVPAGPALGVPGPAPGVSVASQGTGIGEPQDSATVPIWSATREAARRAAEQGRTYHVYRAAADGDPLRCVITTTAPRAAAGYLSVTADGEWTETWRGQEQPLQPGPHELLEPDYPITLSEARELARACRLEVHVSRAGGRAFVSLSEPGTTITHKTTGEVSPAAPVVCFEYGTREVFAGRRSTAPGRAIVWLSIYRETVDEWSARHRGDIFAATDGVRDWQRRLAYLVPHLPTGPDHERAVSENLDSAIRCCRRGDDGAAEQQLRRAEDASPGLVLAPAREAAITDRIASDAPGYAWTGSPARYIAEIMDATRLEWDWIDRRVSADPSVFSGDRAAQQPSAREAAQQKDAAYQKRKAAAQDLAHQAKVAYDEGRYGEALALIDDAEILNPVLGRQYDQIREEIAAAARRAADGAAADPRPPAEPGARGAAPGAVTGQDDAQQPAQAAPGAAATTPPLANAASAPGSADGDEAPAVSDSQPGSAGTREAAGAGTDTTSGGQPEWMGQVAAAQVVADRLYLDGYVTADGEHDALEAGLAAAREHLGEDAVETTQLISAHRKSSQRRGRLQAGQTARITDAVRATGVIGDGAHLHTEAIGPDSYRISMPHRTAETLGLDGDTGRGERMIGVKLGEPVTVLEPVTRGPQWTTVTIRVGSSRPYASTDQASADLTWAREAYQAMLRASGGFLAGSEEGIPAAVALVDAWQALPDGHLADVPQELVVACTEWADAAGQLANAVGQDRGDTFRATLDETARRARLLAGRMTATAAAGGFPGVQLPASPGPPGQDAPDAPADLSAMLGALAANGNLIIAHVGASDGQAAEASPPGSAEPIARPAAPGSPAGNDPVADEAAEADRPFSLLTRVRQIDGGAIITDPQAPDGFRQASPDGTVVAYTRPGWVAVLFDDAMQRESDRYCEILTEDALRIYRPIGAVDALSGHDLTLLAEHLTPAQISELPAPGPVDAAQAPADPAANRAAGTTAAAGPGTAGIVITECADNLWEIAVGDAALGTLSWVGGTDGTVDPTSNELLLFNADGQRIASLYPSGGVLPAAVTEGDYRVCLAGSGREIARQAPLEDAVREALAAAGDTTEQTAPRAEEARAAPADGPEGPGPVAIVITDAGSGRHQITLNGADAGYLSWDDDEWQLFDADGRHVATLYGRDSQTAAGEPEYIFTYPADPQEEAGRASLEDAVLAALGASPEAAAAAWQATMDTPAPPGPFPTAAEETLAGRITIDGSRTKPVVSGTDYEQDPQEFRKALRDHHFRWRKEQHHWEYVGPRSDRARHVTAIRETIARLDAEAAQAAATRAPAAVQALKPLTGQQQEICDAAVAGDDLLVQALAGTGKTTTLTAASWAIAAARPNDSIVYTSFTKSVILDARKGRFGRNVTPSTMHSLARRALLQTDYAAKLESGPKGAARPDQWAQVLGIPDQPDAYGVPADAGSVQAIADGVPADAEAVAAMVMATIKKFRDSDAREPTTRHLPPELATHPGSPLARAVVDYARKAWANISDPGNAALCASGGALQVSFDDYLKVWALSGPRIDAHVIMFDEAQDVNACMREVILQQADHAQLIFVGDSQQSIYAFRGAQDSLPIMAQRFPAARHLPLTQSWRFGPALAEFANLYLELLGSPLRLQGNPGVETVIGPVEVPDAIICRTNATAVAEAVTAIDAGKRVAFASDRGNDVIAFARAARDLKRGRRTKHPDLAQFRDWDEVTECAYSGDEAYKHLQTFVRLIKDHGPDELIDILGRLVSEKDPHDLTIGTVHQAKGLEWDRVRIAGDFKGPAEDPATGEIVMPSGEALRAMYVAVTRARKNLDPGPLAWVLGWVTPAAAAVPEPDAELAQAAVPQAAEPTQAAAAQAAAEPARRDEVVVNLATWSPPEPIPAGWLIVNAPREIGGEITWEGDFRHGMYWAAAPAETADRVGWEALDAWPVRFITDDEIAAQVALYLAANGYPSAEAAGTTMEELARDLDLPWAGQTGQEPADAPAAAAGSAAPGRTRSFGRNRARHRWRRTPGRTVRCRAGHAARRPEPGQHRGRRRRHAAGRDLAAGRAHSLGRDPASGAARLRRRHPADRARAR